MRPFPRNTGRRSSGIPAPAQTTPNCGGGHFPRYQRHVLRVSCRRCERIVEIQKTDAVRLYGGTVIWKDVGQRLLDNTCQQRTGRHEEDGCWPAFDTP
jgi:hypothetical protein